ncbi:MAG: amylo-alpha-1,6-glucosidase, partial [Bacteroidota bacterium]
ASPRLEILPLEHFSSGAIAHLELVAPRNGQHVAFEYQIEVLIDGQGGEDTFGTPFELYLDKLSKNQDAHLSSQSQLSTDNAIFNLVLERGVIDLACLTTFHPTGPFLEAGVPWYTSPFGRDAILTAYQTLMLGSKLAKGVLRYLAAFQGKKDDPFRDEEPGKILHERRFGELASLREIPQTEYYGSIDSTVLFLILLSETFRWTGDLAFVRELWDAVEGALMWIDAYGDLDGDGFVEYETRSELGLVNQAWKDSGNSVIFPDASLAETPIAMAEVQGYVYDAKRRTAELCYLMDLRILGDRLVKEAEELKAKFNQDFWCEEDGFYAEALDGKKRKVNTMTSNVGQALWSGIIDMERVPTLVQHLMAPDMFNGWGIRTLSAASPVYNPLSYHNGTVWPHDNSLIAKGFADHGFKEEAVTLMDSLFQTALHFDYYRLPELFCGFGRSVEFSAPVPYPVACSSQSWAAGSTFLLLQSALGLVPDAANSALHVITPMLPPWLEEVNLTNLQVGESTLDLQFMQVNGITTVRVLSKQGKLKVLIEG